MGHLGVVRHVSLDLRGCEVARRRMPLDDSHGGEFIPPTSFDSVVQSSKIATVKHTDYAVYYIMSIYVHQSSL